MYTFGPQKAQRKMVKTPLTSILIIVNLKLF